MKNRVIIYILSSIILIIIVCFFCLFKYKSVSLDENLLNKKWYQYDTFTGYYNTFTINENSLSYVLPGRENSEFLNCKNYTFNKANNNLNLDCGKQIQIGEVSSKNIVLTIDSKKVKFFENIDDSLNYEFESYFKKSISEYKNEMARVSELIKINSSRFFEIVDSGEKAKFIFYSNNCTSVDCVLALDFIEKLINVEKIYYIDINEFTVEEMNKLNLLNSELLTDKNYYDGIYPRVLIFDNKELDKNYELKCTGFNCTNVNFN